MKEEKINLNNSVSPTAHGQSQLDKLDKAKAKTYVQQQLHILGMYHISFFREPQIFCSVMIMSYNSSTHWEKLVCLICIERTVPRSGRRMPIEVKRRREGGRHANLFRNDHEMINLL